MSRFLHTRLRVRDAARSIVFYDKLGFSVVRQTLSPRGFPLTFMKADDEAELELTQLPGDFSVPEDLFHIAIEVESFEGFKLDGEPTMTKSGNEIAFMYDPDGYEIELIRKNKK